MKLIPKEKYKCFTYLYDIPKEKSQLSHIKSYTRISVVICNICNEEKQVNSYILTKDKPIESCGCLNKKSNGLSRKEKLYNVWQQMRYRCNVKTNKNYYKYGARGISVCKEWDESYLVFRKFALENGYKIGLSIDRINNDGNYEPSNCRWVNMDIQSRNTRRLRNTNTSNFRGVDKIKNSNKYRSRIKINYKEIKIGSFSCPIEAAYARDLYIDKHNLEHTKNFERIKIA